MPRKRLSDYSRVVLPLHQQSSTTEILHVPYEELTSRDVLLLQVFNTLSITYVSIFLIYIIKNDNFLHVGKWNSLYIPFVHTVFEYIKFQIFKRRRVKFQETKDLFLFINYILCTCLCYCVTVLFGAELTTNIETTFVFSSIVTAFISFPLCFYYDTEPLNLLQFHKVSSSPLCGNLQSVAYGSIIGAWFGAFVIPLDWNRDWQQWPIPCVIGSLVGLVLGHAYSFVTLIK